MIKGFNSTALQVFKRTSRTLSSSAAPIKIYGFPLSQPFRSVILLCKSANIEYEMVLVDALKGQNLKPEFKKIHPAGLLPAIEEDGLGVLGECSAILVYLAETRQLTQWYPSDPVTRAKINSWMSWNHANTRLCTSGLLRNKLFPPRTGGGDDLVAAALKTIKGSLTFMDKQLQVTKYLVQGDHPTIADLVLLTEVDTQSKDGFDFIDFTPYPNVVRWMGDMRTALPSYGTVFEPVNQLAVARAAKLAK